jgi:hypothetical protein
MKTKPKLCIKSVADMLKNLFKATKFCVIHVTVLLKRPVHFGKGLAGPIEGL